MVRSCIYWAIPALMLATPVFGQIDISGEWAARVHEDQPHRGPGAELGDYTGLPINAAVRQKASTWDASILSLPEQMAKPHPSEYAEHTWDGFSTGVVEGNQLTITTTHMKYGVIQRNGVASSAHASMT